MMMMMSPPEVMMCCAENCWKLMLEVMMYW